MRPIDLLFTAHNRLEFTKASWAALIEHTNWALVRRLHVLDDRSSDGTAVWLSAASGLAPADVRFRSAAFGGPVAAMNLTLDRLAPGCDVLGKVDNDLVVCPGWLDTLTAVLDGAPGLDVLGFEAGFSPPVAPVGVPRSWRPASHVGGIGLFRTRVFRRVRPRADGRFGWTRFQRRHAACGWVTPDLPCFLLDHLPVEPWRWLSDRYVEAGWQRRWPVYDWSMEPYWSWWAGARDGVAA